VISIASNPVDPDICWSKGTFGTTQVGTHLRTLADGLVLPRRRAGEPQLAVSPQPPRFFDVHPSLAGAINHITDLAAVHEHAEVFVHRPDGSVESLDRQG